MDFTKLTVKSQEAVAAAQELARRNGNPELYPEHLLLALLDQELPRELVPDAQALRAQAEAALAQKPRIEGSQQQPGVSAAFSKVLDRAADEARSSRTSTSPRSTSCSRSTSSRATSSSRRSPRSPPAAASPRTIRRARTRRSRSSAATSPRPRRAASSTRSSAATRRSAASSRCSRAARRTTPSSSASRASARPRSSRGSRSGSSPATSPSR